MARPTLTIRDDRTGKEYVIPIEDGAIRATELGKIKVDDRRPGPRQLRPGVPQHGLLQEQITYIDGDRGILRYRGYPIEELAEKSTYLEVAYLIVKGELPTHAATSRMWQHNITHAHHGAREREALHARASATTRIRWACWSAPSARSPPSIPTRRTSATSSRAACRPGDSSARCRPSRRSPTGTAAACRTSTRTTTCPTPATSSRCCSR